MIKNIVRQIAVLIMIAALSCSAACTDAPKGMDENVPAGTTGLDAGTEVYIDVTDAPSETATSAESKEKSSTDAVDTKTELIGHQWNLSAVYQDGEERRISVQYGSVVRQTGAYIAFSDDDTFQCVLGLAGCKGTYSVEDGEVTLHITTKYDGSDEGTACDEYEPLDWDHEAGTLSFDFNGVTNVFSEID